ncbi:MAG: glycerol-3-phosphate acyltransferase [Candidatus Heimdallarchaeaceae archaeon]
MHLAVVYVIVFLSSYVVGSIPFSWIVTKLVTGKNLREEGSGNVGGRNVYRATQSKKWMWVAGLLDVSRSVVAVAVPFFVSEILYFQHHPEYTSVFTNFFPFDTHLSFCLTIAGLGAILGHNWPLYLLSSGGKGITVVLASMLVVNPIIIVFWIVLWPIVITIVGYSSIAYIVVTALCGVSALFLPEAMLMPWAKSNLAIGILLLSISLIMLSRQRDNFRKIKSGEAKKMKIWKALGGKKKISEEILK